MKYLSLLLLAGMIGMAGCAKQYQARTVRISPGETVVVTAGKIRLTCFKNISGVNLCMFSTGNSSEEGYYIQEDGSCYASVCCAHDGEDCDAARWKWDSAEGK
jgi:hypothetical protein